MKIDVVQPCGFCAGVRRAIDLVKTALNKYEQIYCFGELIHNEQVTNDLLKEGLFVVKDLSAIKPHPSSAVVIRSHGATPLVYEFLKNNNINIIDATCPIVKRIQMLSSEFSVKGYKVLIFGDKNHEEVKSLIGFSHEKAVVINSIDDVNFDIKSEKTILISQSTKDETKLFQIRDALLKRGLLESNFYNTICSDIKTRQRSLSSLAGRVDLVLILGSKNSANTGNLYAIAREKCVKSFLVSRLIELPGKEIKQAEKIGVATGASTPYNFLISVKREVKNLFKRGD
ncbi:MAG: 4-hydroxy-3-methylbut-2-enyl diphosphate reductase [Candidatus Saelkia tenebricola]|nr:4-hydroxy-3-methylbut-2-enyl diphosphate reductase [Candidatus Saelkia tenebricola]